LDAISAQYRPRQIKRVSIGPAQDCYWGANQNNAGVAGLGTDAASGETLNSKVTLVTISQLLAVRAKSVSITLWRVILATGILAAWELYARFVDSTWTSQPSAILARLGELVTGRLPTDIAVTLSEIGLGFLIGVPIAVILGLWLGRTPTVAALLRPIIVTLNSVPVVALAPLLIMWFGLGLAPKVAMVASVVFFLVFFNTLAGAQAVDQDLVETLQIMGATRSENFQKIIAPASVAWILAGLKAALPYSLIAATVGEMLLSQAGLGNYIATAGSQFDLTGVYCGLLVLMLLGATFSECAHQLERIVLRWRPGGQQ
jgi:NitT/TauT family transport system permease protein